MKDPFHTPRESIFYKDNKLHVAQAYQPITKGHSVVIWNDTIPDMSKLDSNDYGYLMDAVKVTRVTLMDYFEVEKVYLMYWDEAKHVHWHLVPRYEEKGVNILADDPKHDEEFKENDALREKFMHHYNQMIIEN